ncbi:hypothetical protein POX_d05293 [Penicillium oxalicum]|uniref:hypothetical protein n=1 Tax=Penicillium oxalicum TaxID=69781 RepID=UPI0020B83E94|nr:hypothetical protein POX_d05293 [Penicillium oxalicum]KAI2789795.1 hypothetical protein POX_d05293 [Penicillium oxalicum]
MAGSKAITVSQFVEQFRRAWLGTQGRSSAGRALDRNDFNQLPRRLGLAVSGGADSMALAFLCRQLERSGLLGRISVTAFVVDHRARVESSQEARTVATWLDAMGIKTHVLELDWARFAKQNSQGHISEASSLPTAFETHARHLRFRALALVGKGAGLAGIPEVARIPECHGIFGVSESGSSVRLSDQNSQARMSFHVQVDDQNKGSIVFEPSDSKKKGQPPSADGTATKRPNKGLLPGVSVATGGIYLCRPLLSFPKVRLLETCHKNKIPYVSDPTNFDPTLTPRNAIRSLLASDSLPRALRAPSILSLIHSSQTFLHTSTEFSNQLLASRCRILDLNLRSGTMVLQIVDLPSFLDPLQSQLASSRLLQIQSLTLRRITELISPFHGNHFPVRSYEPFVDRIFSPQQASHESNDFSSGKQPSHRGKRSHWEAFQVHLVTADDQSQNQSVGPHALTLVIRQLQKTDIARIRLDPSRREEMKLMRRKFPLIIQNALRTRLAGHAPGSARFTLPLLAVKKPEAVSKADSEHLVALPTVDFRLDALSKKQGQDAVEFTYCEETWKIKWEWMFKMIDTEAIRLMGGPEILD